MMIDFVVRFFVKLLAELSRHFRPHGPFAKRPVSFERAFEIDELEEILLLAVGTTRRRWAVDRRRARVVLALVAPHAVFDALTRQRVDETALVFG